MTEAGPEAFSFSLNMDTPARKLGITSAISSAEPTQSDLDRSKDLEDYLETRNFRHHIILP